MKRSWLMGVMLAALLASVALPILAAPAAQEGGGVHFGSYVLERGNRVSGDLVVFGGPAVLREDSAFDGDLTVFGPLTLEHGARMNGHLVVMGEAEIGGEVAGDVFTAGRVLLKNTAYVNGDVVSAGVVDQESGAVVTGDVLPVTDEGWQVPWEITLPAPLFGVRRWGPSAEISRTPRWVTFLWRVVRGVASVIVMGLLALVLVSLWPVHIERVGRAIEEAALTSFGMGMLALILAGLAVLLLTITICLSPFAVVGLIIVGIGLLLGWVALGLALGRRILSAVLDQSAPKAVTAAIVGTTLITLILAIARVYGALHTLLLFLLIPPTAGAVVLTRFGTRPYATRGSPGARPQAPIPSEPPAPVRASIRPDVAPEEAVERSASSSETDTSSEGAR